MRSMKKRISTLLVMTVIMSSSIPTLAADKADAKTKSERANRSAEVVEQVRADKNAASDVKKDADRESSASVREKDIDRDNAEKLAREEA